MDFPEFETLSDSQNDLASETVKRPGHLSRTGLPANLRACTSRRLTSMDTSQLVVSLPGDAPDAQAAPSPSGLSATHERDVLLAAISLPEQEYSGRDDVNLDVNLDESRSESSSSQPSNSLATGGALGGSSSEPSPEDVLYEHHELYGTGAKGLGA